MAMRESALGLVLVVFGCGSSTPANDDGGPGDASVEHAAPHDASSEMDAAEEASGPPRYEGYIVLLKLDDGSYADYAAFNQPPGGGCTTPVPIGTCESSTCDFTGATSGFFVSAGTIQVTGTNPSLTLKPNGVAYPPPSSQFGKLWMGGETITATAAGATVPAFTLTLTAPTKVSFTAPTWPSAGNPLVVDATQPLVVSWTGGGTGDVVVVVSDVTDTNHVQSITCLFDQSLATASVPTAVFGAFPPGDTLSIDIDVEAVVKQTVGPWSLKMTAQQFVNDAPLQLP